MKTTRPEFEVHKLNQVGQENAKDIGFLFTEFMDKLEAYTSASPRHNALVKTKLEEACFFAKKAMALNLDNQEKD